MLEKSHSFRRLRSGCRIAERKFWVANPASPVRVASRTVERAVPSFFPPGHRRSLRASGRPPGDRCPSRGRNGWLWRECSEGVFHGQFLEEIGKIPARTASSRTRSQTVMSKLPTSRLMCLCVLGSGEDIMSSSARWSRQRRAISASKICSAQECDTSSPTNDEGVHCENQEGGCQIRTTCSVEYSYLASKTDGPEPSVSILGGRQRTILRTLGPWCTRRVRSHRSWPGGSIAQKGGMIRKYSCCPRWSLP